jgi:hypothetical protein
MLQALEAINTLLKECLMRGLMELSYLIILLFGMQMKQLSKLLDEDPAVMERRTNLAKRLELYRSAQSEIDAVAWSK